VGRTLTLVPVIASLVAFIAEVFNRNGWWVYALDRASYVLVVLAVVAALLTERRANALVLGAQVAAAATALVFMALSLVKFYGAIPAFGLNYSAAEPWANEAQVLALAALAFGLTLARRRSTVAIAGLLAAMAAAFGCAIYAITQKVTYTAEAWWSVAIAGAFLAAAAAAGLERDGIVALGAPEADTVGDDPRSDPGLA
jgi:hypothetical protein